jgi:hypothetical protein
MARASRDRCFYGTIKRLKDENGHPVVYGKIKVNDGFIYSQADDDVELGKRLDDMVRIVLDLFPFQISNINMKNSTTIYSPN